MNKEKFEKKVKELYAYEDEMLAKMNEIIKPYNEELNKQGCEIVCKFIWEHPGDERYELKRLPIVEEKTYFCFISFQFQDLGRDYYDSEGDGFQLLRTITAYKFLNIAIGFCFKKFKTKRILKDLEKDYNIVMTKGLALATKEILKEK